MKTLLNTIQNLKNRINSINEEKEYSIPEDYKIQLSIEENIIRQLIENFEFQILNSNEKHAKRISLLASCKKIDGNCVNLEKLIKIYDNLITCFPYILAFQNVIEINQLEKFCKNLLDIIDTKDFDFNLDFIKPNEVEIAFSNYNDLTNMNKFQMFEHCYEKIENLYSLLISHSGASVSLAAKR